MTEQRDLTGVPWSDYTPAERLATLKRDAERRKATRERDWENIPWSRLPEDVRTYFEQEQFETIIDPGIIEIPPRTDRERIGRRHGLAPSIARRLAGETDEELEAAAVEQLGRLRRTRKRIRPEGGEQDEAA